MSLPVEPVAIQATADPAEAPALARAVEAPEPWAVEARLARLAMELEAQPQEAKQAPVRVVRERAAEAVAEVEALQLGAKRVSERGARDRAAEMAAGLEAREAKRVSERGAQRQGAKPG